MSEQASIYREIHDFLAKGSASLDDLKDFVIDALQRHPMERRLLQEWLIGMVVKERFTGSLYADVCLTSHHSFSFEARNLAAKEMMHAQETYTDRRK